MTTATKELRLWEEWQQMQLKATREVFMITTSRFGPGGMVSMKWKVR